MFSKNSGGAYADGNDGTVSRKNKRCFNHSIADQPHANSREIARRLRQQARAKS